MLGKIFKNDIRSNNRHFKVILLMKLICICIIYFVIFDNNIVCVDQNYEFDKYTFIIKLH